ncbi:MAG TPA: 2-amino-4-hydroxy-6-hydroxymethyldihydropteridine diphosphokinase [Thiobacillaceae bacterium]|nr:2-amino-4-hydroxy-6-hydroxymethyldihydropteridine diphosphokinase [Thiobacillaceae bacterium]
MPARAVDAFVALGANLGDPQAQILAAIEALVLLPETSLARHSSLYRSKPVGYARQPDFINAVAHLRTRLGPRQLLEHCLALEQRHGRRRTYRNAPRTLDLDVLLYNGLIMAEPGLTLPHPRMHERAFVLLPLAEIAPHCPIPGRGTASQALARVDASGLTRLPGAGRDAAVPLANEP